MPPHGVLEHFQFCYNNVHTWRDGFASLEWDFCRILKWKAAAQVSLQMLTNTQITSVQGGSWTFSVLFQQCAYVARRLCVVGMGLWSVDIICCVFEHFQFCSNNVRTWRDGFASLEWDFCRILKWKAAAQVFSFFLT